MICYNYSYYINHLCLVHVVTKTCDVAFSYIYINVSYIFDNTPPHMVVIQYKEMDLESGNWTSGLFCNTSIVERINGDTNQNIRCRLFHVKDSKVYKVQLVLESDSEINTTILYSSYHPANEAFFCYSSMFFVLLFLHFAKLNFSRN